MENTVLPPPKPTGKPPKLPACEYGRCSRHATKTIKYKNGKIAGFYCEEHYNEVRKKLREEERR